MMAVRPRLQADCNKTTGRRRHAWWAGRLFGLLLALLVTGSVPTVHGHDDPGLYDEECPLLCLAVTRPGVPLPPVPAMAPLVPAPDPVAPVLVLGLTDVSRASFDPRAPPPQTHLPVLAH
jgi:hypothetical protein